MLKVINGGKQQVQCLHQKKIIKRGSHAMSHAQRYIRLNLAQIFLI